MAESTLALQYKDLAGVVGFFLGYTHGALLGENAFSSQQQKVVDECVASGLRQFYFPPPVDGLSYDWSFLKPVATLNLPSGAQTVQLYDDFGGMEGQIYLSQPKTTLWWPLDLQGVGDVLRMYSEYPTTTGRPQMAAVEPLKPTSASGGQRFQLRVWPIADTNYTLRFQYYVNPDYLNSGFPYHMGGMPHTETIRAACLMAAEEYLDDSMTVWHVKFEERVAASMAADRKFKPQHLGYNADNSDHHRRWMRWDQHGWSPVNYRGVTY